MAYNVKYRTEFTDILGIDWRVDIEEDAYAGSILTMTATDDPITIEYLTYSDDLLTDPIKGSTVTLNLECTTNFQYIDLYSEADMTYRLKVYYGDTPTLFWQGWVSSDYSEPYDSTPYTVSITAADGLGLLKYIEFKDDGVVYSNRELESEVILNILAKIGYTEFDEFINLYEDRTNSTESDSILTQIKLEQLVFEEEDCYTALVEILKHYNAIIRQHNGKFIIYRPIELVGDLVYGRTITASTVTATTLAPDQYLYRSEHNTSTLRDFNGGVMMMKAPAASINATQDYGLVKSWIKNSEFDNKKYDNSTGNFDNWQISEGSDQFTKISNISGWGNEKYGVAIGFNGVDGGGSPVTTDYIYQQFGFYSVPDSGIIEFSFDYMFKNLTDDGINSSVWIRIKDTINNIWLLGDENAELSESSSACWITLGNDEEGNPLQSQKPGFGEWKTVSKYLIGITKGGPYELYIYGTSNVNLILGIKNIVFRQSFNRAVYTTVPKLKWWQNLLIGAENQSLLNYFKKNIGYNSGTEIVEREYNKTNGVNGENFELSYNLGDVSDTDIANVIDEFNGALSIEVTDSLNTTASNFVTDYAVDYVDGDVTVTSTTNKIRFTSSVAGTNFDGSTSITNVTGDLAGSVATIQANVTAVARVDEIELTGTGGEASVTCDGITRIGFWAGSIDATGAAFVSAHAAAYASAGTTLTYSAALNVLRFTASTPGQNFVGFTSITNIDGDLDGNVYYVTANRTPVARIDEITLSGNGGIASIICDDVQNYVEKYIIESYTENWSTRGNTESSNLLELITDEIATLKSKGRQFVQLNIMENDEDTLFNIVSNIQDPINAVDDNYRVFIPNRGTYDIRNRAWTVDLIEIGTKAAPAGVGYETELVEYIDGLSTELSEDQLTRINNLITTLKSGLYITNLSDYFDVFALSAGETQESSLKNLVKDSNHGVLGGTSPAFTEYEGFESATSNGYINTNFNPFTQGINFTQTDNAVGIYVRDDVAVGSTKTIMGNGTYSRLMLRYTGDVVRGSNNGLAVANLLSSNSATKGFYIIRRNSNTIGCSKNGAAFGSSANNSTTLTNYNYYVLGDNNADTFRYGSDNQVGCYFFSKAPTDAEALVINNAIEAYMDANSKGVI